MTTTRTILAPFLAVLLGLAVGCGTRPDPGSAAPAPATEAQAEPGAPGAPGAGTGNTGGGTVKAPGTPIKVPPFVPKDTSYYGTQGGRAQLEQLVRDNCPDGSVCLKIVPVQTDTVGNIQCKMIGLPDEGRFLPAGSTLRVLLATPCDRSAPQDVDIEIPPKGGTDTGDGSGDNGGTTNGGADNGGTTNGGGDYTGGGGGTGT